VFFWRIQSLIAAILRRDRGNAPTLSSENLAEFLV
jgi:hypothetical protein